MVPETGVEPVRNFVAADFKPATSTNSVIPAPKPMLRTLSGFRSVQTKKGSLPLPFFLNSGAGDESRTRDLNLGKVALYQLSYSRGEECAFYTDPVRCQVRKLNRTPQGAPAR